MQVLFINTCPVLIGRKSPRRRLRALRGHSVLYSNALAMAIIPTWISVGTPNLAPQISPTQPLHLSKLLTAHCINTAPSLKALAVPQRGKGKVGIFCDLNTRKSRKSRNTWSNRQIWPMSTKWSRAKANRVLQENTLVIPNTLFQQHKGRFYMWTSPDGQCCNQTDYILCS